MPAPRLPTVVLALLAACTGARAAAAPAEADLQGFYASDVKAAAGQPKSEARVVAWGDGAFKLFLRQTDPKGEVIKVDLDGKLDGATVRFSGKPGGVEWTATCADGALQARRGADAEIKLRREHRDSPRAGAKPPQGAIVLLDGKDFSELVKGGKAGDWKPVEGNGIVAPKGGMNSKRRFDGSFQLHVEFRLPLMPKGRGQGRSNSGVYLPNGDEIQVLDSFGATTYKGGGCGGLYAYKDPDAFDEFSLASFPPLVWQTFDVEYRVDKKDGKPAGKPRVTVLHNGIKIHDGAKLNNDARSGGFHFQDHGNPVQYRNIWVLPLE